MTTDIATLGIRVDPSGIIAGVSVGEREFNRLVAAAERTSAQVNNTEKAFNRFSGSHVGLRKVESSLASIGLAVVGIQGPFEKLTSGLLMFGAGGAVSLALVTGLTVIGKGYELFTEKTRKSSEETQKWIDAQLKAAAVRANPNIEATSGLEGASARVDAFKRRIADLERTNGTQMATPGRFGAAVTTIDNTAALAKAREELEKTNQAIAGAQGAIAAKGFDLIRSLSIQAATFGMSDEAAQRYALAMDGSLDPALRKSADAILTHIQRLREAKEYQDAAKKSQDELTARYNAFWDEVEAKANLAGPMVVKRLEDLVKAQRKTGAEKLTASIDSNFALAELGTKRIERPDVFKKMDDDAKLFEETWKHAIRGTQDAFAQFFESIGQKGFKLASIFEGVARAIQKTLAQLAAQSVTRAIFGGLGGGGGLGGLLGGLLGLNVGSTGGNLTASEGHHHGGFVGDRFNLRMVDPGVFFNAPRFHRGGLIGSDEVPIIAQRGERILPRGAPADGGGGGGGLHVHMSVVNAVSAIDGPSAQQFVNQYGHLFVGKVFEAIASSPQMARYIVAQGSR